MIDIHSGIGFWLIIGLVAGAATTLQAAVGFGFNLLATPILLYLYRDPTIAVPAMILAWYPVGIALVIRNHREINYRHIAWWIGPAIPCALLGVWLLRGLDAAVMGRVVGAVTVISAALIILKLTKPVKREWPWMLAAGGLSGVLASSTGMGGPPIVLLGINQSWPAASFRATMFLYFTILLTFTLGCYIYESMIIAAVLRMTCAAIPGLIFGYFAGNAFARHLQGKLFRRIAIALLILAGIMPWLK